MQEWLYKAPLVKVPYEQTRDLAVSDGFIYRTAYQENGRRVANTIHVEFKDLIHMYYAGGDEPHVIGSFEVVGPRRYPGAARLGKCVTGTTLFQIKDEEFAEMLATLGGEEGGYPVDPQSEKITGWPVILREDIRTPDFMPESFPGQSTLVRCL